MSEHNPLILTSAGNQCQQSKEFRFELAWIKHEEFMHIVQRIWEKPTRDRISLNRVLFKLKKVKKTLKGWGYNLSGARKRRKKEIKDKLSDLELMKESCCLNEDQITLRIGMKIELLQILDEEELYWFKRCHENWLLKGDNNTKNFHRVAKGKKEANSFCLGK
jgi:hypothetical protein